MLAARIRSGLEKTFHDGTVAISGPDGWLLAWSGEIDRPFYLRSSAKPFQAFVSQVCGAGLQPTELALAAASHRGHPVHIALVEQILRQGGLSEGDLQCPSDWPLDRRARDLLIRRGEGSPRRGWHNCSGKHAAFLRGCLESNWPTETYLSAEHPLQLRVAEYISELGEYRVEPVGVDGCGAPVLRTTARAMSLLFARLATVSALSEVFEAMHRYPGLVSANGEVDAAIATATNSVAKVGAMGCIGIGLKSGLGLAVKSWDGLTQMAGVAAVAALDSLGALPSVAQGSLQPFGRPTQMGGGMPQGFAESRLELNFV